MALAISTSFAQATAPADSATHIQSFSLLRTGVSVKILWQTATEKNNNYFEIQRSTDGEKFSVIALVFAKEDAFTGADYQYIDNSLSQAGAEFVHYRIRQVDMQGKSVYTMVRKFRTVNAR
jgi:hypothetical protein